MNLWCPFWISCYFYLLCFCSQLQAGSWPLSSGLFSIRPSATAVGKSLALSRIFEEKVKYCAPTVPGWVRHPIGMVSHMKFAEFVNKLVHRATAEESEGFKYGPIKGLAETAVYESLAKNLVIRHFHDMAALELHACEYIVNKLPLLANLSLSFNFTEVGNNTYILTSSRPPVFKEWQLYERFYRASIFASVACAATLWIVLLLRTRLGSAFTSLLMPMTRREFTSTSPSSFMTGASSHKLTPPPTSLSIAAAMKRAVKGGKLV